MTRVKLGAAALNTTPLAWRDNARVITQAIDAARAAGVSILCLPELCITGYGAEDAFQSPAVLRTAAEVLRELAPRTVGMAVALGLPVMHRRAVYNAAAFVVDGAVAGLVGKRHLAGDGIHYEPRWFKAWPEGVRDLISLGDREVPIGDLDFDLGEVAVGFEICEDAWVANRPGAELSVAGVDVILNPSASHFAFGKQAVRERIVVEGSRAFGVAYVYANLLGNEAGRVIYDGGGLIASGGELVAAGPRLSFRDYTLTTAEVDLELTRMRRARSASYVPSPAARPVAAPLALPALEPAAPAPLARASWETNAELACEEFRRAVALGLRDYLRKSRARGFVVSLSGGADSAAVSCLVGEMAKLAVDELGLAAGIASLGPIAGLADAGSARAVVGRLLTCVYQATEHSSETTREAARGVAEALGARFVELEVGDLVAGYSRKVEAALGRELSWQRDDLALQNIQARVRGPGAWMIANLEGAILLATSNRSEAAVGYATMDGDTCGGLSPIGGIDKAFLRRWLRWLESELPALVAVNVQAPTAELRPRAADQTDEDDLMPYDLLDAIEVAAIRDKRSPLGVFRALRPAWPDLGADALARHVERFFRLWCRNQWKRERYAPSFHLDDENLDPKTWCRFPILSGGYERELAELADYAKGLA